MKTVASIEDIRAEMQRRIDTSSWGGGWCSECPAPLPYRILPDGIANWTANVASTKTGCESFILDVIASVRKDYDLPAQSLTESVRDFLSSRKPTF
jgi:hypothetical protein